MSVFSRTWIAVLAGSVALWGMSRLGDGVSVPDVGAGSVPPVSASGSAATAPGRLAACLEQVASLDGTAAAAGSVATDALAVERRYRARCRPLLGGAAFDAFALAYGERSRGVVAAIVEREERLAAELIAGPQGAVLDPDVVWAAALLRAAQDVRGFAAELSAWFDARFPVGADQVVVPVGVPAG
ncbi:MAG: hypothetical protein F4018_00170 [Acidobacteria bacterium]|nr:hypothetical protein [Acidobacteriota bacterium]MYH31550.1 hypothetical protein [Acidobacteriota bacterium]MYK86884.1 hypothetical protein [Acidobacteriota bacterium]